MAQKVKFGDLDLEVPSFDFKKLGGILPIIIILFLGSMSFYTVDANFSIEFATRTKSG